MLETYPLSTKNRHQIGLKLVIGMKVRLLLYLFLIGFSNLLVPAGSLANDYQKRVIEYRVPNVTLINQDHEEIKIKELLNSETTIILNFIYSTCTTVCPVLSASFAGLQRKVGDNTGKAIQFVSISIDPENDTPEVMKQHLKKYHAKPGWNYLTGAPKDIKKIIKAFDAYIAGDISIVFMKSPQQKEWLSLYGPISTRAILEEYRLAFGESLPKITE